MSKLHLVTRSASTFLYALEFLISALILGIFSYFLAHLARDDANPPIPQWEKAVEGISGAAVLYTIFAVLLTCFFGGITFFALIAVILDVCFCGGMIAIAILARGGRHSCGSVNNSPIGPGHHVSCQLERATFIVAIVGAYVIQTCWPRKSHADRTLDSSSSSQRLSKSSCLVRTSARSATAPALQTTIPLALARDGHGNARAARPRAPMMLNWALSALVV